MENIKFFIGIGDVPMTNKMMFGFNDGSHYTLLFNEHEKVVDFHRTIELPNGKKDYESLFKCGFYRCLKVIASARRLLIPLVLQVWFKRKINLGKLKKYNLTLFPFDESISPHLFHGKKKRFNLKSNPDYSKIFVYPEDLDKTNANSFWVYSSKKGALKIQGILFRHDMSKSSFYFIRNNEFRSLLKAIRLIVFDALKLQVRGLN